MLPLQIYIYGSCFYKNHVFRRPGLTNCRAIRLLLSQCLNCLPTFFDSFVIDHLYSQPSLLTFIQLVMKRGPAQLCFHIRLTAAAAAEIIFFLVSIAQAQLTHKFSHQKTRPTNACLEPNEPTVL